MKWVVVGAGSAGCVVTRRLLDAGHEVTLVESGPTLRVDAVPAGIHADDSFSAISDERVHRGLVARRLVGQEPTPYLRGRGLGGSSAVNAMVALRGDPALYRSWGWTDVEEAYERALIPERMATDAELGAVDRALLAASPNAERMPLTRRGGRRVTSAEAYLWPVLASPRLQLTTDTTVDTVVVDRSSSRPRATGARLADGSRIDADRVVVCAGAIHSPAVLLRSGIDVPGVGAGLQDHPAAAFLLELRDTADAPGVAQDESGVATGSAGGRSPRRGLATASLIDRDPVQILAMNHLGGAGGDPPVGLLMVANMRPRSASGTVRLESSDPHVHPIVDLDLLSDRRDLDVLRAGVHQVLELLSTAPFEELVAETFVDDVGTTIDELDSDDAINRWLLARSADYVHASSSCAMGRVVEDDGKIIGHDGAYVCDASVFPGIPNANTHLPTTMLAERLAARWTRHAPATAAPG